MSKLKVKFLRYKNVVLAEVLEQDESLRGIWDLNFNKKYSICSFDHPAISESGTRLYIRGESKLRDHCITYETYVDEYEAKKAIKNFTELINEINAEDKEDKADEGFETTIVG